MQNWYNLPTYYDVSFSHEMQEELAFLKAIFKKYCPNNNAHLLEPACGTGRLLVPLCRAGYCCTGFDINDKALQYLQKKLDRNNLKAKIMNADMSQFTLTNHSYHAAYCTVDTFRHLLSESDAKQHLKSVANTLKTGGIYILGLHLLPKQGITSKVSRWVSKRGRLTVRTSMTMIEQNIKKRTETLKVILNVVTKTQSYKYESIYRLRTYSLRQFKNLIYKSGEFEIENIYDDYYDITKPVKLNTSSDYGIFILRKR